MTKVLFKSDSKNRKTGNIAITYSERTTCPDTCKLKKAGCYADGYPTRFHWDSVGSKDEAGNLKKSHFEWEDFLLQVKALPKHKMLRLNVAGDLPGTNNKINRQRVDELVDACGRIRGFTFTHKPVGFGEVGESPELQKTRASNSQAVKHANQNGFTINLSADDMQQADYLASLKLGPVVTVMPTDAPRHTKTPEGRHVVICPNEEDKNMTCERCGLCSIPNRKAIIGFRAHGYKKNHVSKSVKNRMHLSVVQ